MSNRFEKYVSIPYRVQYNLDGQFKFESYAAYGQDPKELFQFLIGFSTTDLTYMSNRFEKYVSIPYRVQYNLDGQFKFEGYTAYGQDPFQFLIGFSTTRSDNSSNR